MKWRSLTLVIIALIAISFNESRSVASPASTIYETETAILRAWVESSETTTVEPVVLHLILDVLDGWYVELTDIPLEEGAQWGPLALSHSETFAPSLSPVTNGLRHTWRLTLYPFLPGDVEIPTPTFRLRSTTDPSLDPVEITSEPITITVTSVLEGIDDFTPGQLPAPPEPLEADTPPTPAWVWFGAGALTMGVVAIAVLILRRPEDEAAIRRRQLQSLRAQLALIDTDSPSLDHLREAHRLLIQLESLTPTSSLPTNLRDDLAIWHERYERDSFAPTPSPAILASLVADSQSIATRLTERAQMRREAS